ncbi:MAG TPA: peptidase domain-containing ABC transporter [Polyangiaceae bacterium]|nr:peptidase domain-containing ABC transporter [Polyangiaceae bacterium]
MSWFRRVPYIAQMELTECGAACLAMVLGYWGQHISLVEAREACGVSRDGATAYAIAKAAQEFGLDVQALSLDAESLPELGVPAILYWEFNHFVVLESANAKGGVVVDPSLGRYFVPSDRLKASFTGIAICARPGARFQPRKARRPSLNRYRDLLRKSLPGLGVVFGASLMLDCAAFVFPAATQILVDLVIKPQQSLWLWVLALSLFAATLVKGTLVALRSWVLQSLQFVLDLHLMTGFVDHLLHLPLAFFQQRTPGDLARRVQDNVALREFFSNRSIAALLDGLLLLGYASLMLAYHSLLGAIVVGLGMLRVVLLLGMRGQIQQLSVTELAAYGREAGALVEALSAPEATKAFGTERRMLNRYTERLVLRANAGTARRRLTLGIGFLMIFLDGAGKAMIVLFGGREVLADRMTIGVFSAFLMLQALFAGPLESLVSVLNDLQHALKQLQRLDDVMETPREPSGARHPGKLRGEIRLENVSFRYDPNGAFVVRDIDLCIRPGEKVAIVGLSGAGKSTLARLMLGMHLPSSGRVLIDGQDLRELDLQEVRRQFGVVLQEAFFLNDTVRENLSLAGNDLPIQALRRAAHVACIDDALEALPEGYETRLGRSGSRLSGGQRQRLAVARAIAHEPAVLLLDEATSSLDLANEARLHANLARLSCTRIVIAHRLATVLDADRIFVLDGGSIVAEGKYDELAARPGLFHDLVRTLTPELAAE